MKDRRLAGPRSTAPASSGWLVLVDFDGTSTVRDADFEIADAALPTGQEGAYEPLARAYEELEIGMREYFEGYLELLGLTPSEIADHAGRVELRPGLRELVRFCESNGFELAILSEGLDIYVLPALEAAGLGELRVSCNRAIHEGGRYRIEPAEDAESCPRCLNCKGAHVARARAAGRPVAIVGNGASDLCGARDADLVLARDTLLTHCEREGIAYEPWDGFADVVAALERRCVAA